MRPLQRLSKEDSPRYVRWVEKRFSRITFSALESVFLLLGGILFVAIAQQDGYLAFLGWLGNYSALSVGFIYGLHWMFLAIAVAAFSYLTLKLTLPTVIKLLRPLKDRPR